MIVCPHNGIRTYMKKAPARNSQVPDFLMWTSQGLNLGPPDYESVKIKFFRVS